ncbi:hypothetical protein ACFPRL_20085 [Pseudoclavibacter helvolus]
MRDRLEHARRHRRGRVQARHVRRVAGAGLWPGRAAHHRGAPRWKRRVPRDPRHRRRRPRR